MSAAAPVERSGWGRVASSFGFAIPAALCADRTFMSSDTAATNSLAPHRPKILLHAAVAHGLAAMQREFHGNR
jgi:hypothetical protein